MSLANMALSKAEKDEQSMICCAPDGEKRKTPNYPWELKLYLNKDELAKLGITAAPAIGDLFTLTAAAIVEGTSQSATADAEDSGERTGLQVTLQITDMSAASAGKSEKPAAEVLYS